MSYYSGYSVPYHEELKRVICSSEYHWAWYGTGIGFKLIDAIMMYNMGGEL